MRKQIFLLAFVSAICAKAISQEETYEVYAIKFGHEFKVTTKQIAVGAPTTDTLTACYMFWLLKGSNGKNILIDGGFSDTAKVNGKEFLTPDKALTRFNIDPKSISDLILTHPHTDHINGIDLFPNATIWMQKDDYDYFVGTAWQKGGYTVGLKKSDVRKIVDINLAGKLKLVKGDNIEIIPGIKVFTGSRHTFESQYVLVNANATSNRIVIASDAIWFYYNLNNLLSIPNLTFDANGYVEQMKRMKTLASNEKLIIPGHDSQVFKRFPSVVEGVVRIQ